MKYKHTQIGYLMVFVLIILVPFFGFILIQTQYEITLIYIYIFIFLILSSFISLRVEVDEKYLKIRFGWGIFRKNFLLENIKSVKQVRNRWYYGWGVRYFMFPSMWIYNVSGFDAVEIILKNGKIVRVGTDEPKRLEKVLLEMIR